MKIKATITLLFAGLLTMGVFADDGAASIAAGGVIVMKREARIVMAKEVLQIAPARIRVDYDFRNDSDEEVTTEVAFPIPDYQQDVNRPASEKGFDDFKLWVNGEPIRYQVEARAFVKEREYSQLLTDMRIDIASFGHEDYKTLSSRDIQRLTAAQRKKLELAGLIDKTDGTPLWTVKKKYHWQQAFPAHKTVHISHVYSPNLGSLNSINYGMGPDPNRQSVDELKSLCIDRQLRDVLQQIADGNDKDAPYVYVDFVLTTANTWKTPIEDFTLIVERPHWKDWRSKAEMGNYVSFCWNEPVAKVDADHFSAHVQNFVPNKELRVGFFTVEHRRF